MGGSGEPLLVASFRMAAISLLQKEFPDWHLCHPPAENRRSPTKDPFNKTIIQERQAAFDAVSHAYGIAIMQQGGQDALSMIRTHGIVRIEAVILLQDRYRLARGVYQQ